MSAALTDALRYVALMVWVLCTAAVLHSMWRLRRRCIVEIDDLGEAADIRPCCVAMRTLYRREMYYVSDDELIMKADLAREYQCSNPEIIGTPISFCPHCGARIVFRGRAKAGGTV